MNNGRHEEREAAMHLFGDRSGPHLVHFHARRQHSLVVLEWEVRNAPDLRWRVLRSETGFAEEGAAVLAGGQTLVMEGTQTHATDQGLDDGVAYYYTVLLADEHGGWHCQAKVRLRPRRHHQRWRNGDTDEDRARLAHDPPVPELPDLGPPSHPV
jgi:hypothetical protein